MSRPSEEFPEIDYLTRLRLEEIAERVEKHRDRVARAEMALPTDVRVATGHPNVVQQGQLEALLAIADAVERIATALEAGGR